MRGQWADGNAIRKFRTAQALTQEDLAAIADCDIRTVRNAEKGRRLDPKTLRKLAVALSVNVGDVQRQGTGQETNVRIVSEWLAAVRKGDLKEVTACLDDQVVLYLPSIPAVPLNGSIHGKEQVANAVETVASLVRIEFLQGEPCEHHPTRDRVFAVGIANVVAKASETAEVMRGIAMIRLDRKRIIEVHFSFDTLLLQRLLQGR